MFGGNLIKQSNGLEFLYDHTGVFAVKYAGSTYFYRKNAQNDIIALLDNTGTVVVKYKYDAWGKCQTTVLHSSANTIAELNPFRYRSYYYDTETGLYFLQTRYYGPEIGRFMTIDDISYLDPDSINGLNLYAYCGDNPVMNVDADGHSFIAVLITSIIIGALIGGTMGGISAYKAGLSGWNLAGAILGGAIMGGAMGAISAIGGAAGLTSLGLSVAGYSLSFAQAAGISVLIGATAGVASYSVEAGIRSDMSITGEGLLRSTASGITKAIVTFGLSYLGGKAGAYDNMFIKPLVKGAAFTDKTSQYYFAKALLAGIFNNTSRNFLTKISWNIGEALTKLIFVNLPVAGIRSIIDSIFDT